MEDDEKNNLQIPEDPQRKTEETLEAEEDWSHIWPYLAIYGHLVYWTKVGYPWKELWKFSWAWHMASMVSHDAKKKKINDHLILTWVCLGEFAFVIWQEIDKKHSLCLGSFQTWTWLFLTRGGVWRAREVRWGSLGAGQVERWAVWVSIGERGVGWVGCGGGLLICSGISLLTLLSVAMDESKFLGRK